MGYQQPYPRFGSAAVLAATWLLSACSPSPDPAQSTEKTGEAQQASFVNADFESGAAGQPPPNWTVTSYLNPGITVQTPQTRAGLNLAAGGNPATVTLNTGAGPLSQVDASLGATASLRWPLFGNKCALVNNQGNNKNVNSMKQTMTVAAADVDPADSLVHVRFAVAPVLQNPAHQPNQQPYYYIQLVNITKGNALVYSDFNLSAQPGVPWKTVNAGMANELDYTDWQLVDIAPGNAKLAVGDQVELEIIAAGCSLNAHWGEVYVDGGSAGSLPGLFVTGTGPANAFAGTDITYTLTYHNGGAAGATGVKVDLTTPPNTTFVSYNAPGLVCTAPAAGMAGTVSCTVGNLPAGGSGSFTITVHIAPAATGVIVEGNYDIYGTGIAPLLGSHINTTINCVGFGNACTAGVGACQKSGTNICVNGVAVCNATPGMPSPEVCDGIDNDCNGTVDNGNPGGGMACSTGKPGVCAEGLTACTNGMIACAQTTQPSAEVCDNLDNDCDGTVDNGNPGGGQACSTGLMGACAEGQTACMAGMIACNQTVMPSMEICGNAVDEDCDGKLDNGCPDTDGDGIIDVIEMQIGTDPNDADSDDDGVLDGQEPNYAQDSDGDGLINALDPDSDNDGLFDGTEMGKDCSNPATDPKAKHCIADADPSTTTDPLNRDTDSGGKSDGSEDWNRNGKLDPGEGDPTAGHGADDNTIVDTDGDGLGDQLEIALGSNPMDADTDDDGVLDGQEPNPTCDDDHDGLIDVLDADSDNDGLWDGTEMGKDCSNKDTDTSKNRCIADADPSTRTSPVIRDTDHGGVIDGSEDWNRNGKVDPGETDPTPGQGADDKNVVDTDGDGLSDQLEIALGSNPMDADSDDDGLPDGQEPNFAEDTDGDGLINVLDPDSDNDGLFDGTEMGKDCSNKDTDPKAHHCIADADPTTRTSPLDRDTDHGGVSDGSEDSNRDGKLDPGEGDPTAGHGADDKNVVDTDGDGLSDQLEISLGSNPNDADTDDDGVLDGQEPNPTCDDDHDGLIDVLDADSDNDALWDGTEMGKDCSNKDTDKSKMRCIADADPTTRTSPLELDTDHGGKSDGSEDWNLDGKLDPGEADPTAGHGADDSTIVDTDGDGLGDKLEGTLGSNPNDADTDDDGTIDGKEPNPHEDTDGDGKINVLDVDSDGDGLFDGTEMGFPCMNPPTDPAKNSCIPDADMGQTTTSPLLVDTDHGGVPDGVEDANHNGQVDPGETDPNLKIDDKPCTKDSDCGDMKSGKVCSDTTHVCVPGCRGTGNRCPDGQVCSSMDNTVGMCSPSTSSSSSSSGAGGGSSTSSSAGGGIAAEGNGILCSAQPANDNDSGLGWIVGGALGMLLAARRRRQR